MKTFSLIVVALATLGLSSAALADHQSPYSKYGKHYNAKHSYADVVRVEPIIHYVTIRNPQRECWEEEVYRGSSQRSTAPATIAGGLVGGVLGRQIGGGSGRDAMTVVGTLVGSAIANDRATRDSYRPGRYETVQRCQTNYEEYEEERIDGYRVTYRYAGEEHTTRMARDPGDKIKVRVSVSPVGSY